MAAASVSRLNPTEEVLRLHDLHTTYGSFAEFEPDLPGLIALGEHLPGCVEAIRALGILEPLSGAHLAPEAIRIEGPNYRESLIANGLLSRNRGALKVLEAGYGSLEALKGRKIYLAEAVTGFALWLQRQLGDQLVCSEYFTEAESPFSEEIPHQDLCQLSFSDQSFDLVLCNELFEHVYDLPRALGEIARVLRPGGRLVATFPLAFGQLATIQKARWDSVRSELHLETEPDYHGDPIRPHEGSLVYCIPGWDVLDQARSVGFAASRFHLVAAWKYGVLGGDIPGVLVMEAKR